MKRYMPYVLLAVNFWTCNALAQSHPLYSARMEFHAITDAPAPELTPAIRLFRNLPRTTQEYRLQRVWAWSTGPSMVWSLDASYHLSDNAVGEAESHASIGSQGRKKVYAVHFQPGFKLSDNSWAYANIGYEGTSLHEETARGVVDWEMEVVSYGLGMRNLVGEHFYLQTDIQQLFPTSPLVHGNGIGLKPPSTSGWLRVGYNF
ncbi:hypothetical protein [Rhodoferax lacus]|uniref:hypothetical protein n=1 Tax=Rhodoferax lacus TaxID=2184758 RepID=UPI0011C1338E|nr:hypothetical protein [Rhodoferax lacus]